MKSLLALLALVLPLAAVAAHPLEGKWLGGIDTDHGDMQVGLQLSEQDGKLSGKVQTAHGDWPVTKVTEDKGTYTLTFDTGGGDGIISGRVTANRFAGKWKTPMAEGTFELNKQ